MKYITTSWDDGHPLDFKVAGLLDKYNIKGTFYIPKANDEHEVMSEDQVYDLSKRFEIGGHTLNHTRLHSNVQGKHEYEVSGSYTWLRDLLNVQPVSFCFPGGVYDRNVVETVRRAGYKVFRTTELLSVVSPLKYGVVGTSLQMYEHSRFTYVKHLAKRGKLNSLIQWMRSGPTSDLLKLADYYLQVIDVKGDGCFHLWGHSWEVEEFGLWHKLEALLKHLSGYTNFRFIQNQELVNIGEAK